MTRHHNQILAAALLIAAPFAASAAVGATTASRHLQPVQLEAVIVTPSRSYTVAEWRARGAERQYAATQLHRARNWLRAVWHTLGLKSHPQEA